jgi:type I restriction enzyme, S subunit
MAHRRETRRFEELFAVPLRNGLTRPKKVRGSGIKMVNMGEIFRWDRISAPPMERVPVSEKERASYLLADGDMLFARQSLKLSGAGKCSIVMPCDEPRTFEGHLIRCRLNRDVAEPYFYYCYFRSPAGKSAVHSIVEQVAAAGIRGSDLKRLLVPYPPLQEQKAIAGVLGALDDKIELNRRMNRTLEQMAAAIFKSWFIDFDPVHAKAAGQQSPGLKPETAALFPDSFQDSELGPIPKGWKVSKFGDLIELAYGKSLRAQDRRTGPIAVYGSNGQIGWHDTALVKGPGIVVGRKGNPGIVTWVPAEFFPIDTTFYVVPIGPIRSLYFLFHALKNHNLASLGADSAVPGLNRNMAYMSQQLVPTSELVNVFDSFAKPVCDRIYANERQNCRLASLRDTLLPHLLSGQLRVLNGHRTTGRST